MRRDKKPLWRWIGEALLIFLSILAAFYVDNYREQKAREDLYLKHLNDFLFDLLSNAQSLDFEISSETSDNIFAGYIAKRMEQLEGLDSLLRTENPINIPTIVEVFSREIDPSVSKWIFQSPHYEKLTVDYYYFIKNQDLKSHITTHKNDNLHRHEAKERLSNSLLELQGLIDLLNLKDINDRGNRAIIFGNEMLNKVGRIQEGYRLLFQMTQTNLDRDAVIIKDIEAELKLWGQSTSD